MIYEEVITHLKRYMYHQSMSSEAQPEISAALNMAIKACEKQVPKRPIGLDYKPLIDSGWMYECPNCGCAVGENKYHTDITQEDNYCSQCGQILNWNI